MARIAVIADIHHGKPNNTKRGDTALDLLDQFAKWANAEHPDIVLDLGDRISDIDSETDKRLEREVAEMFARLEMPVHHVCGNHDNEHLSVAENAKILGVKLAHQLIDLGDWQVALWSADAKIRRSTMPVGFNLPETDLLWLSRMAQRAKKPTLVASHVPISGHSQIGNYHFHNNATFSTYPQSDRARSALSQDGVPIVCIAGHVHWNTITTVDGISHITQQSLTESFTTAGEPARAWGMLTLTDKVHWQVMGNDPFEARLTPSECRWTPPMAKFTTELSEK